MNDFEQFLKRQQPRRIPPEWRAGILAAARAEQRESHAEPANSKVISSDAHPWWLAWLWPSPAAWGAVACAWLVILGLNIASGELEEPERAATTACAPVDLPAIFAEQQRLIDSFFPCQLDPAEPRNLLLLPRGKPGAFIRPPTSTLTA